MFKHSGKITELSTSDVEKIVTFSDTLLNLSCYVCRYSDDRYDIRFETFNVGNVVKLYNFLTQEGIKE